MGVDMSKYTEFYDWLGGAEIYIGYARYAQFGEWGFVVASAYDEDEQLEEYVKNLSGGDCEALDAADEIKKNPKYKYAFDRSPSKAMQKLEHIMREWQNKIINELESD